MYRILLKICLILSVTSNGYGNCGKLNQAQFLSSHNSYKLLPHPKILFILGLFDQDLANSIEYFHLPIGDQLEKLNVRHFEIDVYADPDGGHYSLPLGERIFGDNTQDPVMQEPGFKVLHAQDVDYKVTCKTFRSCLKEVQAWSALNPGHWPITIQMEPKDSKIAAPIKLVTPIPFSHQLFLDLEQEILEIFPREKIITPDSVQGEFNSLENRIRSAGWPRLETLRGKVMFALDAGQHYQEIYKNGASDLAGRLFFIDTKPGQPDAAYMVINDPVESFDRIQSLVRQGYLVRTRADADTSEARIGDLTRYQAALASGAQFISTDFPHKDLKHGHNYQVQLPGGGDIYCR